MAELPKEVQEKLDYVVRAVFNSVKWNVYPMPLRYWVWRFFILVKAWCAMMWLLWVGKRRGHFISYTIPKYVEGAFHCTVIPKVPINWIIVTTHFKPMEEESDGV